ncbi:MAG: DUF4124 domain-containing protein [Burkholderiales bacterium]|nr:DUF4124 domain-containing protein [Burkholderiales bacterium]
MLTRLALCAALLAAAAAPPVTAQVHRWVDEQGQVHYGDRPMSTTASRLRIRAESATAPAAAPAAPAAAAHRPAQAVAEAAAKPAAGSSTSTIDRMLARQRAAAAAPQAAPTAQSPGMAASIAQCKAHRGVDCETPQGLRNLQRENTPITREEQARIAGVRARRAACARAQGSLGC